MKMRTAAVVVVVKLGQHSHQLEHMKSLFRQMLTTTTERLEVAQLLRLLLLLLLLLDLRV